MTTKILTPGANNVANGLFNKTVAQKCYLMNYIFLGLFTYMFHLLMMSISRRHFHIDVDSVLNVLRCNTSVAARSFFYII